MKQPNETPPAAEFGKLRSYLARAGYTQQQITDAIGSTPNNRSRAEIAEQLEKWIIENLGE